MPSNTYHHGQTVWITDGEDKGKEGTFVGMGFSFGTCEVRVGNTIGTYRFSGISHKKPTTIPLPPSFLPTDFKMGELVEVHGHHTSYNGLRGTIVRLPTSTSYRDDGDLRYAIEIVGKGNAAYRIGNRLYFEPRFLRTPVNKPRYIGDEIDHADVQIGDTIRTELRSTDGNYTHVSSKEGKVYRIEVQALVTGKEPWERYSFSNDRHHGLNFNHRDEKITLLDVSPDPFIAIVDGLTSGTVVVHETDSGVNTYVKSLTSTGKSQWHLIISNSSRSSTFVEDEDVIKALNNSAEIVHKVRKKPIMVQPPF